jgi:hypothetical protein
MISSLPGENIKIENEIHNNPISIELNLFFPSSPLITKNNPTNNIKKYHNPIISPLILLKYYDVTVNYKVLPLFEIITLLVK